MPKKFGENSKKTEAKERLVTEKKIKKTIEEERKEAAKWEDTDKEILKKAERQKALEEKKIAEQERKAENKRLYEEEMASIKSNKGQQNKVGKRAMAQAAHQQLLLKTLAKAAGVDPDAKKEKGPKYEFDSDDDGEYKYKLEENPNRKNPLIADDDDDWNVDLIDATGVDEALRQIDNKYEKHPEKRMKASWTKYMEDNMPILKKENPSLKRSQLLDILHKEWKKSPENPMNQTGNVEYNTKIQT